MIFKNQTKQKNDVPKKSIISDGHVCKNNTDIAGAFNSHFASVGKDIKLSFAGGSDGCELDSSTLGSEFLLHISLYDVSKIILLL